MSSGIQFACTGCGKTLLAPSGTEGKRVKCTACAEIMIIPSSVGDANIAAFVADMTNQSPFASKFCHHCGKSIAKLAEICPGCGVRQPHVPGMIGHIDDNQSSRANSGEPDRVIAALLAFFLGLLGAHKFYLGQTQMGALYLILNLVFFLTIIVPLIFLVICIIEGITYLSSTQKDFAIKYRR